MLYLVSSVSEKPSENQYLKQTHDNQKESFSERPVLYSLVQGLRRVPPSCLSQSMVGLVVVDEGESFVDLHHRDLELREGLVGFANFFRDGRFGTGREIKIYDFVREARELIAETKVVFARFYRREVNRIVLFPLLLIDDLVSWSI